MRPAFASWILVWLVLLGAGSSSAVEPVQFLFTLPPDADNPFTRDLWADVLTPSQKILRLPVFVFGNGIFAVRARAAEVGDYRLGTVTERDGNRSTPIPATAQGQVRQTVKQTASLPQVMGYRGSPSRFLFGNNTPFTPIGANVPWASTDRVKFHLRALADFNAQGLNWMRIWMAHWGGLNLDWLPADMGASPRRGTLDLRVADDWDKIVSAAEEQGVYLQMVLQHHGQYSTTVNPNWKEHPWNKANRGGFLVAPGDFFTATEALGLTALKYRYIVARWGYSPSILAWELFNEVHWTDPINLDHDDTAVAQWHDTMATYLRQLDRYHHLVTTSTDNLRGPIYAKIDFYQPHLYAANQLAGVREFAVDPRKLDRPIFYGEFGDDHMGLSVAQKDSGVAIVPPVWASLMGEGRYAAQPWLGEQLIQQGRLGELGAVARFLKATRLCEREELTAFSPAMECGVQVPLVLFAGQVWQRRPAPEITVPLDGREPLEFARIPRNFAGSAADLEQGFPNRATFHFDTPQEIALRPRVTGIGAKGSTVRLSLDGQVVLEKTWIAAANDSPTPRNPAILSLTVPAGKHTVIVENPGGPDWFELTGIETSLRIPVLAAVGKRGADFLAAWVWHREGVYAVKAPAAISGTLLLEDVPAGSWQVTWWDALKGVPLAPQKIEHAGGLLRLPTPAIDRHAAVVLTRMP
jgi:Cellulase (glycosyl hydrolase family 5)